MTNQNIWDRECFRKIAERAGLDSDPRHIEDLYTYFEGLHPILRSFDDLDLTGLEPCLPNPMKKEVLPWIPPNSVISAQGS